MINIGEFSEGISFQLIKPDFSFHFIDPNLKRLPNMIKWSFQKLNTVFPVDDKSIKNNLQSISQVPKMSTLAIGGIINRCVKFLPKNQSFVNIGVWNGFSFFAGLLGNEDKTCIGVDNFSEFGSPREQFLNRFNSLKGPNHSFYDIDYEQYFLNEHKGEVGLYFYDGEHSYKNQLLGLQIIEPYLAKNAIILVDDTNLDDARNATLEFIRSSELKYKIIFERRTAYNRHPTFWNGVMIIERV